jgi:hypothetical protein
MTFDEAGHCSSTLGTCTGVFEPDPTGLASGNVWVFTLPELWYSGNGIKIGEPGTSIGADGTSSTISDILRFIGPNNDINQCIFSPGVPACADRLIFYSLDDVTLSSITHPTIDAVENADGTFQYVTGGGIITLDGSSAPDPVPGPIVGAGLPGLIFACGGLLALARRRQKVA